MTKLYIAGEILISCGAAIIILFGCGDKIGNLILVAIGCLIALTGLTLTYRKGRRDEQ